MAVSGSSWDRILFSEAGRQKDAKLQEGGADAVLVLRGRYSLKSQVDR